MFWDFLSLRQESCHQVSFLFGDRGTPDGFRHMNGYGSHTFKMVNKDGEPIYCKFHYKVRVVQSPDGLAWWCSVPSALPSESSHSISLHGRGR